MREFAREYDGYWFKCTAPGIDSRKDQAFHSEEEARSILESHGLETYFDPDTGFIIDGKCRGEWVISPKRNTETYQLEYWL